MKYTWITALALWTTTMGCASGTGIAPGTASELRKGATAGPDTDDGECEDGVDAKTGLPCKDDDDASDGDNVQCEDGIDAKTGLPCKDDNTSDGPTEGKGEDGESND